MTIANASLEPEVGAITARDVMTANPITITDRDTVAAAWELLARGSFHHLPVVHGGRCVGVLDDRALLQAWRPGMLTRARRQVGEVLDGRDVAVRPEWPITGVAALMRREGVDAVPVVDAGGRLLGLVTAADIVGLVAGLDGAA